MSIQYNVNTNTYPEYKHTNLKFMKRHKRSKITVKTVKYEYDHLTSKRVKNHKYIT